MKCAWCEREFSPREAKARFCQRSCKEAFYAEEHRKAVSEYRARRENSMFGRAMADEAIANTGRFAKEAATVNGAAPTVSAPASPQWSQDFALVNDPDPLGYAIDDLEQG